MTKSNNDRYALAARAGRIPGISCASSGSGGASSRWTPDEWDTDNKELEPEGMMFVGDKGKILARFHGENPQIIPQKKMREYAAAQPVPGPIRSNMPSTPLLPHSIPGSWRLARM